MLIDCAASSVLDDWTGGYVDKFSLLLSPTPCWDISNPHGNDEGSGSRSYMFPSVFLNDVIRSFTRVYM